MENGKQQEYSLHELIHDLAEKVEDRKILRRVWKILERAYAAQ